MKFILRHKLPLGVFTVFSIATSFLAIPSFSTACCILSEDGLTVSWTCSLDYSCDNMSASVIFYPGPQFYTSSGSYLFPQEGCYNWGFGLGCQDDDCGFSHQYCPSCTGCGSVCVTNSDEEIGQVSSFGGLVFVNGVRADENTKIAAGDTITTFNGRVSMLLNGHAIQLGPFSTITVSEETNTKIMTLDIFKGQMFSKVRRLSSSEHFEIQMPQAVAAVRGTQVEVETTEDESRILSLEDSLDVSTLDGSQSIWLSELQEVIVTAGGIGEPFPVSPSTLDHWWNRLVFTVASPVNLYVTDPLGRHVGTDENGNIIDEIPGAEYTGMDTEPEEIDIPQPVAGNFGIDLFAVGSGVYNFFVAGFDVDGGFFVRDTGSVEPRQVITYQTDYGQNEESKAEAIDIKPGDFPNWINHRSRGVVPVAILTTVAFDAATVDPETVRFGPNEITCMHSALKDVDGDGDSDLILQFKNQDTGIVCGSTSAYLVGETFEGQTFLGYDSISTVGCN